MSNGNRVFQVIAQYVAMVHKAGATRNDDLPVYKAKLLDLVKKHMPSGSGFDNGTKIDMERSTSEKLVFYTAYHHMDANGSYDGWTEHTIFVKANLAYDLTLSISGPNKNDIKYVIEETFYEHLSANIKE